MIPPAFRPDRPQNAEPWQCAAVLLLQFSNSYTPLIPSVDESCSITATLSRSGAVIFRGVE